MAREIDQHVVQMEFDNKEFERNVQASLTTLDKLKMALNFDGAKGLDQLTQAAKKVSLKNLETSAQAVSMEFTAMKVVGLTAVSEMTKAFMGFGKKLWNMSFGQMASGGMSRALKVEQANFQMRALAKNLEGIGDSTEKLEAYISAMSKAINKAVTGTAYGYDAAAAVTASLMASGVTDADEMLSHLNAIAGAAAMTGRSFEDIGNIFTTVASNGRLMTMQLRQFSASGLNASAVLAKELGTTEAEVNELVTKGGISFEEFSKAMNKAFGESAHEADKTYSGILTNVKAALSRIGQLFAEPYIQNMIPVLQMLKKSLNSLNEALKPIASRIANLMKFVSDRMAGWLEGMDFTRIDIFFRGIENVLWSVAMILEYVRKGFQDVFPPKTTEQLRDAALTFESFTANLMPSMEALEGIRNIVGFLMRPIAKVLSIVKAMNKALLPIIASAVQLAYTILTLVGNITSLISAFFDAITGGNLFGTIFDAISVVVVVLILLVDELVSKLNALVVKLKESGAAAKLATIVKDLGRIFSEVIFGALSLIFEVVSKIAQYINLDMIVVAVKGIANAVSFLTNLIVFAFYSVANGIHILLNSDTILGNILNTIKGVVDVVKSFFTGDNTDDKLSSLNQTIEKFKNNLKNLALEIKDAFAQIKTGDVILFAAAVLTMAFVISIIRLVDAIRDLAYQSASVIGTFSSFTGTLKSIRNVAAHAKTFMYFAGSILLITGALYELAQLPMENLLTSAKILAVFSAAIVAFSVVMGFIASDLSVSIGKQNALKSFGMVMIGFGAAILALSTSVYLLSNLDIDLKRALVSVGLVTILIFALTGAAMAMSKFGDMAFAISKAWLSIVAFALAVNILVKSINSLSAIDLTSVWKNIAVLIGAVSAIGFAASVSGAATARSGLAILAYAVLLQSILSVFKTIIAMDPADLERGLSMIYQVFVKFLPVIAIIAIFTRIAGSNPFTGVGSLFIGLSALMLIISSVVKTFTKVEDPSRLEHAITQMERLLWTITIAFGIILAIAGTIVYFNNGLDRVHGSTVIELAKRKITKTNNLFGGLVGVMLGFAASILGFAMSLALISQVPDIENGLDTFNKMLFSVTSAIVVITLASGRTAYAKIGPTLANMITAIGLLGSFMMAAIIFAYLKPEQLNGINSAMGSITLAFIGFSALMLALGRYNEVSGKTVKPDFKERQNRLFELITIFLGIAVALISVVGLFKVIGDFIVQGGDDVKMWINLGVILAGMTVFIITMLGFFDKFINATANTNKQGVQTFKTLTGMIFFMVSTVGLIWTLFEVASRYNDIPVTSIVAIAGSVALVIGVCAATMESVLKNVSKMNTNRINRGLLVFGAIAAAVLLLSSSTTIIAHGLSLIPDLRPKDMLAKLGLLGIMLAGLFGLLVLMQYAYSFKGDLENDSLWKSIASFAGGVAILALSCLAITQAVNMLPNEGKKRKMEALGIMLAGMGAVVIAVNKFGKNANPKNVLAFSAAMIALSGCLIVVSLAIKLLDNFNESAINALAIVGGVVGAAAAVMTGLAALAKGFTASTLLASAVVIAAMSAALLAVSTSVSIMGNILNEIDQDQLNKILLILGGFVVAFTLLSLLAGRAGVKSASLTSTALGTLGIALAGFGLAILSVGTAIYSIADAMVLLHEYRHTFAEFIHDLADAAEALVEEKTRFRDALIDLCSVFIEVLTYAVPKIAALVATSFLAAVLNFLIGIIDILPLILELFSAIVHAIYDWAVDDGFETFFEIGYVVGSAFVGGLLGAFVGLTDKILEVMDQDALTADVRMISDNMKVLNDTAATNGQTFTASKMLVDSYKYLNPGKTTEGFFTTPEQINQYVDGINAITAAFNDGRLTVEQYKELIDEASKALDEQIDKQRDEAIGPKPTAMSPSELIAVELATDKLENISDDVYDLRDAFYQLEYGMTASQYKFSEWADTAETAGNEIAEAYSDGIANNKTFSMDNPFGSWFKDTPFEAKEAGEEAAEAYERGFGGDSGRFRNNRLQAMAGTPFRSDSVNILRKQAEGAGYEVGSSYTDGVENGAEAATDALTDSISDITTQAADDIKNNGADIKDTVADGLNQTLGEVDLSESGEKAAASFNNALLQSLVDNETIGKYMSPELLKKAEPILNKIGIGKTSDDVVSQAKKVFGFDDIVSEDTEDAIDSMKDALTSTTSSLDGYSSSASKAKEETDKLKESISSALDIFTDFNSETEKTTKDVLKSFMSQIDGVSQWSEELKTLGARGLDKTFLEELAEAGPSEYENVHAMYVATDAELSLFNEMYREKLSIEESTADDIRKSFGEAGQASADAYGESLEKATEYTTQFIDDGKRAGDMVLDEKDILGQWNSSHGQVRIARWKEEGFKSAEAWEEAHKQACTRMVPKITESYEEVGEAAGNAVAEGTESAMSEMERGVRDAGYEVTKDGVITGRRTTNKMAGSVKANSENVVNAFGEMGEDAIKEFQDAMEDGEVIGGGIQIGEGGEVIGGGIVDDMVKAAKEGAPDVMDAFAEIGIQSMEAFRAQLKVEEAIDAVEAFQTGIKSAVTSAISLFDEVSEQEEISADQMIRNMTEQVKQVGKWASNLKTLAAKGVSEGLLQELQALGPAGAAKVEAFVKMSDAQLQKANKLYANSVALPDYVADKLTKSYANAGFAASLGFTEGIDENAATAVMQALGVKSLDALKEALDIHSPSGKTMEAGMYAVLGFAQGVSDNLYLLQDPVSMMGGEVINALGSSEEEVTSRVSGLFAMLSAAYQTAIDAFKESAVYAAIQEVIDFLSFKTIAESTDISPTISPVLDLSNYNAGKAALGDLTTGMSVDISRTSNTAYDSYRGANEIKAAIENANTRVINEMTNIRNDISTLQSSMAQMKIQMNGQEVGYIVAPYVNMAMGQQYTMDRRTRV